MTQLETSEEENTDHWKSESGYIWSMLGTAVGFANLLGFGSQCYRNGGGAFLVPFFVAMFILGIPMLCLEGVVGQRLQSPLVTAYGLLSGRKGKFFGWLSILAVWTIGSFYLVLTAWSAAYTYFSGMGMIPADTEAFFVHQVLGVSSGLENWGSLSISLFVTTVILGIYSWWVISRDIQSGIERWCSIFLPLLTLLILIFAILVAFLPGSMTGLYYYLTPDFSKIWNLTLWRDVFGHLFFSFSLGLGIVVGYSRHNKKRTDIPRAMMRVAIADFLISFIAGFVIFGSLGYMSYTQGIPFEDIVSTVSNFDIGYVIFPLVLKTFGDFFSRLIGVFFFFSLFIGGITGVFSIIESIAGNIQFEFQKSRKTAVSIAISGTLLLASLFCMGNGTHIIDALGPMVLGNNMLVGGIAQIIVFLYLTKEISNDPVWFQGNIKENKRTWNYSILKFFALPILIIILSYALKEEVFTQFNSASAVRWMWFACAASIAFFLARKGKEIKNTPE